MTFKGNKEATLERADFVLQLLRLVTAIGKTNKFPDVPTILSKDKAEVAQTRKAMTIEVSSF